MTTATNMPTKIFTALPASIARTRTTAMRSMSLMKGQATNMPARDNIIMPRGTRTMSSFVLPAYSPAISMVRTARTYEPIGLPGAPNLNTKGAPLTRVSTRPPENAPIIPVTAAVKMTRGFALSFSAMPAPMPAPISIFAMEAMVFSTVAKTLSPHQDAICAKIVPAIRVQKSPCAIPVKASIK